MCWKEMLTVSQDDSRAVKLGLFIRCSPHLCLCQGCWGVELGDVAGVAKGLVKLLTVQWAHVHVRFSVGGEVLVYRVSVEKLPTLFSDALVETPRRGIRESGSLGGGNSEGSCSSSFSSYPLPVVEAVWLSFGMGVSLLPLLLTNLSLNSVLSIDVWLLRARVH